MAELLHKVEKRKHSVLEIKSEKDLIMRYRTLVKRIAHHLITKLPPSIQEEDLVQSGMIGLLEAAKKYDHTKGASFETYAGIRIRGSMLDEIRRIDWAPRSVHKNSRMIASAMKDIEDKTGRFAKDSEVADDLGISLNQYYKILQDTNIAKVFAFGDMGIHEDSVAIGITENVGEPHKKLERFYLKQYLSHALAKLPDKENLVLTLYYEGERNLREIGDILGITESRVSQIHSQAMVKLQVILGDTIKQP